MKVYVTLFWAVVILQWTGAPCKAEDSAVKSELDAMKSDLNNLVYMSTKGSQKGKSWNFTAEFVDKWGHRISGSQNLNDALDDLRATLTAEGIFSSVSFEPAMIPHWVRGKENVTLLSPMVGGRQPMLLMLGLGSSIGTGGAPLEADVLVVTSWADLVRKRQQVKGKIVLYTMPWEGYSITVGYRSWGATIAAKFGAVGSLIRSVGPFSIRSPHTGSMNYYQDMMESIPTHAAPYEALSILGTQGLNLSGIPKIPHAALTVEDAYMLKRMSDRGSIVTLRMCMEAENLPMVQSHNVVVDVEGSAYPDQIVLMSGHLDSWDVGQGAMDDAGPAFVALHALRLVAKAGLRPKRTMRWVGWTTEERGSYGGNAYYELHKQDRDKYSAVMELDNGIWSPDGIVLSGSSSTANILKYVANLALSPIDATNVHWKNGGGMNGLGIDVSKWMRDGVPDLGLSQKPNSAFKLALDGANNWDWESTPPVQHFQGDYFFFHHTEGDTMMILDSEQMDRASATVAVHMYAIANLNDLLPRAGSSVTLPIEPTETVPVEIDTKKQSRGEPTSRVLLAATLGVAFGALLGAFAHRMYTKRPQLPPASPL